jgi:hypothetical protein
LLPSGELGSSSFQPFSYTFQRHGLESTELKLIP